MTRCLRCCVAAMLLAATPAALASFHLFRIEQLYSNADRSVQFIVMHQSPSANGENLWEGIPLTSTSAGITQTFTFPANLPSSITANRRVLIATEGFAALGLVPPDYVVPNGFLATQGGTLNYAGVDQVTYSSLPTDGINAIDRNGAMIQNVATNFAGQSGLRFRGSSGRPESARPDRLLVRAGDQRAGVRSRGVSRSVGARNGSRPGQLVYLRHRRRWRRSASAGIRSAAR